MADGRRTWLDWAWPGLACFVLLQQGIRRVEKRVLGRKGASQRRIDLRHPAGRIRLALGSGAEAGMDGGSCVVVSGFCSSVPLATLAADDAQGEHAEHDGCRATCCESGHGGIDARVRPHERRRP